MPRMGNIVATDDNAVFTIPGGGNFQFSATRIEKLGATEYTLVHLILDVSGSVEPFKNDLLKFTKLVIDACKKSPRVQNLMLRFVLFNSNLSEVHGFKEFATIDPNDYKLPVPNGNTALFDATYDGVGATLTYAEHLIKQDFMANGAVYILTDGMENNSKTTEAMIKKLIQDSKSQEKIESLVTILVGMHDPSLYWAAETIRALKEFKTNAGIDQFIDIGAATPQNLAKLADFVSRSVSSTSTALGTGAASQPISAVF